MAVWSEIPLSRSIAAGRLDAEYYEPALLEYERAVKTYADGWKPLSEIAELITDGDHMKRDYQDDGVLFLTSENVAEHRISYSSSLRIDPGYERSLARARSELGAVFLTKTGKWYGKAAVCLQESPTFNISADIAKIRLRPEYSPFFVACYLNSTVGYSLVRRESTGGSRDRIILENLRTLPVPLVQASEGKYRTIVLNIARAHDTATKCFAEAESLLVSALGLNKLDLTSRLFYERSYKDAVTVGRLDAEYFQPPKWRVLESLAKLPGRAVGEHYRSTKSLWQPAKADAGAKVRNYDLTDALSPFLDDTIEPTAAGEIGSAKKRLQAGDLVVSRLRSYLKEIAVVLPSDGAPMVGSTEFIVLRPNKGAIRAEALLVYLRSPCIQTVLKWCQDGSNHPRFDEKEILRLRIPKRLEDIQDNLAELIGKSIAARREARRLLDDAKALVEDAILSGKGARA